MGMRDFVLRRAGVCIVTIFAVITVNFFLFRVMPASPVDMLVSPLLGEGVGGTETKEELIRSLGLDKPLWMQFVIYIQNVFTGNFGYSFITPRPVIGIISDGLLNTMVLMLAGNMLAILMAIVLGVLAAWKRGSRTDVMSLTLALTLSSMPMFWVGGIILMILSVRLGMFPLFGTTTIGLSHPNVLSYMVDYLHHLFLPMVTMGLVSFGGLFLITRSALVDVFSEDYIITAKAVGMSNRTTIFRNALRNAMLPLITMIAVRLGFMIGGSVLTETVFSWPGLGWIIYNAVNMRDYPILQGAFMIITIVVVLANFAADIIYGYLDPRVRVGASTHA